MDEDKSNEDEELNEMYRDVNVNLEGRDTKMTDASQTNVQATQVVEDTHVIITGVTPEVQHQSSYVSSGFISNMLNPNPDTGIDSILNLNTKSTSLVDVPITTNGEMPPSSVTTLPPPLIPLIQPLQQTPVSTPTIVPKYNFLEFKQRNLSAEAVSSILGIVDKYLANKMNKDVKAVVQLQSDRLRDEAQAKNEEFINKLDNNIKKIIKEQVKVQVKEQVSKILPRIKKSVNEQLEVEVLNRSSNEAKTSHAIAANLSELKLKKTLIDKMENSKSIHRSVKQKTLYKALVDAYETDKDILETYRDTFMFKRRQNDKDEDEEPFAGSNRRSKRRRAGKEPESTSAPKEKTSMSTGKSKEGSRSYQTEKPTHTVEDLEEPAHQEFNTRFTEDQPVDETTQFPDWFQKPAKPPTPDHDWNKTLLAAHGPIQLWIGYFARKEDPRKSFNEPIDTPLDFSAFVLNRLKVDTLTPKLLAGPTFELMKGSCKSLVELEYFLEEVYKATTNQLECNNPDGQQYPHDLRKPLPLIPNSQGKLKNLTIEERLALGVLLRMFTKSIVLKRRVEDLQLGVKSYQNKLNLTKPDMYRSDLKRKTSYTAYSNPRGFIYQNKDKKNILMRIDELYKFSDGTLNDVWSALDDILKRIRIKIVMEYPKDRPSTSIYGVIRWLGIEPPSDIFTMKMEILLESTSNKLMVGDLCDSIRIKLVTTGKKQWCDSIRIKLVPVDPHRFEDSHKDGHGVKEFQRSFSHSDTERLSRSDEVLKLKNFKKDATLKLFKSTNQERYEHVGPKVTSSQDGKVYKKAKRDYAWLRLKKLKVTYSLTTQAKEHAQALNSEEFVNVFVRISFGSAIELVFQLSKSQVLPLLSKFVCGFRNSDCGTGSQSDNTVGSPHGFIIHWIVISKNIKKVTEVIDVENWRIDNFESVTWIVSLIIWNSSFLDEVFDLECVQKVSTIEEIDQDAGVTLVTPTHGEDQPEDQLGVLSVVKVLADAPKTNVHTYTRRRRQYSTGMLVLAEVRSSKRVQKQNLIMKVPRDKRLMKLPDQFKNNQKKRNAKCHNRITTNDDETLEGEGSRGVPRVEMSDIRSMVQDDPGHGEGGGDRDTSVKDHRSTSNILESAELVEYNTYARALIEASSTPTLVDSLIVPIPFQNGSGHTLETLDIEYKWKPSCCDTCKIYDHMDEHCPKNPKTTTPTPVTDDGFVEVNQKEKGKHASKPRHIDGIKRRRRDLSSDGVRDLATASGRGRLKEDLESST
ncbi:hypothetical protein Tco_0940935 [Tanacetum coccineum]|uniref:Zinc knuckle CX2CX4HX4C n=1 Tax=Tanacetum coccineum TaxID=301880 RepID=A0ABQ5DPE8_9ASTR